MTFLSLGFLIAGLLAAAIPIIIHLLSRQRKRPIEWAAMRFLLEAFRKQRKRLQLEQLVLLTIRCLILMLLGAALAQPILKATGVLGAGGDRVVFLVIDDGLVSGVTDRENRTALARQIEQAKHVLDALGPNEPVGLLTAARPVRARVVPPTLDHAAVSRLLDELTPAASPTDLPGVLASLREAVDEPLSEGRGVIAYLFSDFRAGAASLDVPLAELFGEHDRLTLLHAPPAREPAPNVQVVGIDPVRRVVLPGATDGSRQIAVRLARSGGELDRAVSRVRLIGEGITIPEPRLVEWAPGQATAAAVFMVEFTAVRDLIAGLTAIVEPSAGSDTLETDNRAHVIIEVRDRIRVAMVSPPTFGRAGLIERLNPGQWIRRALAPGDQGAMEIIDVNPSSLDEIDLRFTDVAFITRPDRLTDQGWRVLRGFIDRGGFAMFMPPVELNVHPWVDRLRTELDLPWRLALEVEEYEHGLVLADDQPRSELMRLIGGELSALTRSIRVQRLLPVMMEETQAERILTLADGAPLMILGAPQPTPAVGAERERASRGLVAYLAAAPELNRWTNLPAQPFMVPLFQETTRQGLNLVRENQRLVTGERPALFTGGYAATDLLGPRDSRIELDRDRRPREPLADAGLYTLLDAASQSVGRIAVNIKPASARTDVRSEAAVTAWLGSTGAWRPFDETNPAGALATVESGSSFALHLLIAAALLALLETMLARWFSHAHRRGGSAIDAKGEPILLGALRPTIEDRRGRAGGRPA